MPRTQLSADSRDNHLTLRRVARQQRLVELLGRTESPLSGARLAEELGVGLRTVERDLARLKQSGVPITSIPGTHGGNRLTRHRRVSPVALTFDEVAALIAALAALGPTETDSAASAMRALVDAIAPDPSRPLRRPPRPVPAVPQPDPTSSAAELP